MEYIEFEEWKKFKKEKKYKEAVETLEDEMATNLIRVHNFYADVKNDEKKDLIHQITVDIRVTDVL